MKWPIRVKLENRDVRFILAILNDKKLPDLFPKKKDSDEPQEKYVQWLGTIKDQFKDLGRTQWQIIATPGVQARDPAKMSKESDLRIRR